jgi:rhodanese-related sulfurtransferase
MQFITVAELTPADYPYLIDVRSPYEYDQGHLPGSINIPKEGLRRATDELAALPKAIMVCNRGKSAQQAAEILHSLGLNHVSVLEGGVQAWQAAGKPLSLSSKAKRGPDPQRMRWAGVGLMLLAAFPPLRVLTLVTGLFLVVHSFKVANGDSCPVLEVGKQWLERCRLLKKLIP